MSEDIVGEIKDTRGRTWQEAFYLQTKAFLEKNSEHIKEIERLKAEVHRLEEIVGSDAIDRKYGMCCDASAQVERLTKAGDAMAVHLAGCYRSEGYDPKNCRAIDIWNAAKEGKQP
jgi:hypothetical protein